MYSPFYCFTVYKKNERTVSDLNRQCLMCIIPIYWGQLVQRGIKGEEGGGGHGYYFKLKKFEKNFEKKNFFLVNSVINLLIS